MSSKPQDDTYPWWVGRRVDVLRGDGQWFEAEVVESAHDVITEITDSGERTMFYPGEPGESDGTLRLIFIDGPESGETASFPIFPGGEMGLVPLVVPRVKVDPLLAAWWRELSPSAKAALSADPDGYVPADVLDEVLASGASVTAAYWPSVQPGPEGFYLPEQHQMFIHGVNLQRGYVLAEAALNGALRKVLSVPADSPLPPEALHRAWYAADVAELAQRRAEAKLAYDAHRVAGFW